MPPAAPGSLIRPKIPILSMTCWSPSTAAVVQLRNAVSGPAMPSPTVTHRRSKAMLSADIAAEYLSIPGVSSTTPSSSSASAASTARFVTRNADAPSATTAPAASVAPAASGPIVPVSATTFAPRSSVTSARSPHTPPSSDPTFSPMLPALSKLSPMSWTSRFALSALSPRLSTSRAADFAPLSRFPVILSSYATVSVATLHLASATTTTGNTILCWARASASAFRPCVATASASPVWNWSSSRNSCGSRPGYARVRRHSWSSSPGVAAKGGHLRQGALALQLRDHQPQRPAVLGGQRVQPEHALVGVGLLLLAYDADGLGVHRRLARIDLGRRAQVHRDGRRVHVVGQDVDRSELRVREEDPAPLDGRQNVPVEPGLHRLRALGRAVQRGVALLDHSAELLLQLGLVLGHLVRGRARREVLRLPAERGDLRRGLPPGGAAFERGVPDLPQVVAVHPADPPDRPAHHDVPGAGCVRDGGSGPTHGDPASAEGVPRARHPGGWARTARRARPSPRAASSPMRGTGRGPSRARRRCRGRAPDAARRAMPAPGPRRSAPPAEGPSCHTAAALLFFTTITSPSSELGFAKHCAVTRCTSSPATSTGFAQVSSRMFDRVIVIRLSPVPVNVTVPSACAPDR